ncbi:hypothetical protein GWK47_010191 [Chionoecetes opilio]|uniref:Uncharacterized protein n=1 Tax=Chionoecetes opilio TaxID=41210 RepID=A0A8J4Y4R2_CHIOP|nr:hypothetical protein GWK47_010191 [Chionoecetes opilio]
MTPGPHSYWAVAYGLGPGSRESPVPTLGGKTGMRTTSKKSAAHLGGTHKPPPWTVPPPEIAPHLYLHTGMGTTPPLGAQVSYLRPAPPHPQWPTQNTPHCLRGPRGATMGMSPRSSRHGPQRGCFSQAAAGSASGPQRQRRRGQAVGQRRGYRASPPPGRRGAIGLPKRETPYHGSPTNALRSAAVTWPQMRRGEKKSTLFVMSPNCGEKGPSGRVPVPQTRGRPDTKPRRHGGGLRGLHQPEGGCVVHDPPGALGCLGVVTRAPPVWARGPPHGSLGLSPKTLPAPTSNTVTSPGADQRPGQQDKKRDRPEKWFLGHFGPRVCCNRRRTRDEWASHLFTCGPTFNPTQFMPHPSKTIRRQLGGRAGGLPRACFPGGETTGGALAWVLVPKKDGRPRRSGLQRLNRVPPEPPTPAAPLTCYQRAEHTSRL